MRWFFATVRVWWLLCAMALLGVGTALMLGARIMVPVIDSARAFGELPFTVILPLVAVVAIGYVVSAADADAARVAVRRQRAMLMGTAVGAALVYAATYVIAMVPTGLDGQWGPVRNAFGYLAMVLVAWHWCDWRIAVAVPAAYVVLATVFGRVQGVTQPWAWPVMPGGAVDVVVAGAVLVAAAVWGSVLAPHRSANAV